MPENLRELGEAVQRLLEQRRLSSLAASEAAGLSRNQVRNIVLGRHRPTAATLRKLCDTLNVPPEVAGRLRILAGIEPDPGASDDARAARRSEWAALLFVAVNDYFLPRFELPGLLKRRNLKDDDQAEIELAAAARSIADYWRERVDRRCSRGIAKIIDEVFPETTVDQVDAIRFCLENPIPGDWHELTPAILGLGRFADSGAYDLEVRACIERVPVDQAASVAIFPALLWHACHAWPIDRVRLKYPYKRGADDVVYSSVREGGVSITDLASALLGEGELGERLAGLRASRPSWEIAIDASAGGEPGHVTMFRPRTESVFDSLDRCVFIKRFPLYAITPADALRLAREWSSGPYWNAWVESFGGDLQVFFDDDSDPPPTPADYMDRCIGDGIQTRVQELLTEAVDSSDPIAAADARKRVAAAAKRLQIDPRWLAALAPLPDPADDG